MNTDSKLIDKLKYNSEGLIPVIVQEFSNGKVLMLAYMNRESLEKTLETGHTCFFSRSRNQLWVKGETSGNTQQVKQIFVDCDNDTLLVMVEQKGVACHTGSYSCFYRDIEGKMVPGKTNVNSQHESNIFDELNQVFEDRKTNPTTDSYVCRLWSSPGEKMPKKIAEEAAEVLIALKDSDKDQIIYETADLWFHTLVALSYYGINYLDVLEELKRRRKE